jgi:hypothetical protein
MYLFLSESNARILFVITAFAANASACQDKENNGAM